MGKKAVVVLHRSFYDTLPTLSEVQPEDADMAWSIYDLQLESTTNCYQLVRSHMVYTQFQSALSRITRPDIGSVENFIQMLQVIGTPDFKSGACDDRPAAVKLDKKLEDENPPDAPTLLDLF